MTLVAGAFARRSWSSFPGGLVDSIRASLSRNLNHRSRVYTLPGAAVVKVDIGAFSGAGVREDARGGLSLLCGDLVLEPGQAGVGSGRDAELERLHTAFLQEGSGAFHRCNGVFSFVHLEKEPLRLVLATDHLGVRPLYYYCTDELFVFSSVLRLFPTLQGISLTTDVQGVAEIATLGYCIGSRTPFREVSRLQAAEAVDVRAGEDIRSQRYFRWDLDLEVLGKDAPVPAADLAAAFTRGIIRRLGSDSSTAAFLSGGLDSRSIVSVLRDRGVEVHTFGFSPPGEKDDVFASAFARAVGANHHSFAREGPVALSAGEWSFLFRRALDATAVGDSIERPRLVWSGDGGSVAVGGVYAPTPVVEGPDVHQGDGDLRRIVEAWAPTVPIGVLPGRRNGHLLHIVADGACEFLSSLGGVDPARRFFLFVMLNDQRCHLDGHFEEIDRHGLEFQLPFFDTRFLKEILRLPLDWVREHRFYHAWIRHLPESISAVPWQTYPGHLSCPVGWPGALHSQWDDSDSSTRASFRAARRRTRIRQLLAMGSSTRFPRGLLSRTKLLAAGLALASGIRDYGYVIDFGYRVFRHTLGANRGKPNWSEAERDRTG